MRIFKLSFCCMIIALLLSACDKGTSPVTSAEEQSSSTTQPPASQSSVKTPIETSPQQAAWTPSDDPTIARFLNYVAPKSATWIEHPPAGMGRIANYTVPGRDGNEAAHIIAHYFGVGQGGDVNGNIARWQSQFQTDESGELPDPIVNHFEVDSLHITTVELAGQWQDMGAVAFKPDQQFIGVIVEIPQGNLFIKFVGQSATVSANKKDFLTMVRGIRASDEG